MLKAADLFCGAGGTSIGAQLTGRVNVRFALNHWDRAIETHSANFPGAVHAKAMLREVSPSECEKIDILFASPECTHHSRARGGRPTSDQQRSGAWEVMPWIEYHRPRFIVVENVIEFQDWGPVGSNGKPLVTRKGAFFHAWLEAIRAAGYGASAAGPSIHQPLPTITTKDRHALTAAGLGETVVIARTDGERALKAVMDRIGVCDVGFRMLVNEELADAQGFPPTYNFCGNKSEVTKQIGNSVSPPVARAITESLLGV